MHVLYTIYGNDSYAATECCRLWVVRALHCNHTVAASSTNFANHHHSTLTTFLGFPLTEELVKNVAEESGVLELTDNFISAEFRAKCISIIPYPDQVEPNECYDAFIYLKTNFNN